MNGIQNPIYYPMLVSNNGDSSPIPVEENTALWKKYLTLPQLKQDILTDAQLPQKLTELQNKLSLSDEAMGQISLIVRKIFFSEVSPVDAVTQLNQKLSAEGVTTDKAQMIVQFVQNDLFSIKPKPKVEEVENKTVENQFGKVVKLPLLKAMTQYERIGDQMVTNEKIKVKGQPEPQRPSLAHWIRYYRDELGVGFHDQVLRGRFLFQSENGKRLSNEERERINLVLKSIEEDFPLDIDVEQGMVIFPTRPKNPAPTVAPATRPLFPPKDNGLPARTVKPYVPAAPGSPAPGGAPASPVIPPSKPSFFASKLSPAKNVAGETLHFSTGHVLPGEKAAPQPNTGAQSTPVSAPVTSPTTARPAGINQNRGTALPRSPYSIRPLRLRDDIGAKEE